MNRSKQMLSELLQLCKNIIPEKDFLESVFYIDHNEMGIAFMQIAGAIIEDEIFVQIKIKNIILALYEELLDEEDSHSWKDMNFKEKIENIKTYIEN